MLDARASVEAAPVVAAVMSKELAKDDSWMEEEIAEYRDLAAHYVLD